MYLFDGDPDNIPDYVFIDKRPLNRKDMLAPKHFKLISGKHVEKFNSQNSICSFLNISSSKLLNIIMNKNGNYHGMIIKFDRGDL